MNIIICGVAIYSLIKFKSKPIDEVYRWEYKEFIDDDTYFKIKDEEMYIKNNGGF